MMIDLCLLGIQLFEEQRDYLLLVGVIMVTVWLMFRIRKKQKPTMTTETRDEYFEQIKKQRGMRGDLEDLMVEIEQMAKRLSSHLDAKTVQLEQMLDQADQRIEQLLKLQDAHVAGGSIRADDQDLFRADSDAAGARNVVKAVEQSGEAGSDLADPLAVSIYELADQGLSASRIAKKLDEHIGKVELILALRKT